MSLHISLSHRLSDFTIDVSFSVPPGITALFGRSGAGKTTILNAIAGFIRPDSASIQLNDILLADSTRRLHLPPHRRHIGTVFQDARLFPHLSVRQNLFYGRRFAATDIAPDFEQIVDLLDIAPLLNRPPATLSGGEQSRVALGRALLAAPHALLLDEPFAALDEARKSEILPYLERLRDSTGLPMLYISHSLAEVTRLADQLLLLDRGRILQAGPIGQVLADPASIPGLGLRAMGALLPARLVAQHPDGISELAINAGRILVPYVARPVGTLLRLRIPASDVILSCNRPEGLSALNILPATVRAIKTGDGPGALVQLSLGQDMLLARITRRSLQSLDLQPESSCFVILKAVSLAHSDIIATAEPATAVFTPLP